MLRSHLYHYNAYIVVKSKIDILANANGNSVAQIDTTFKNNTPFNSCISKTNNTLKDNAENLMSMHSLSKSSDNYSTEYRNEKDDVDENVLDGKACKYKSNRKNTITAKTVLESRRY